MAIKKRRERQKGNKDENDGAADVKHLELDQFPDG